MVKFAWITTLAFGLTACGSSKLTGNAPTTTPFQDPHYLTLVGFTGSVVKREKRFSGYSKTAQRVSLINPVTEAEVWGRQLEGTYDLTAPLPDYSGIALLSGQQLTLVTETSEKAFAPIEFPIGYVGRASESATYGAVSLDGQSIHVIRQIGLQGEWQEQTFASPFQEPPSFAAPPGEEPPLGIVLFNDAGNQMVYFKPSDGRYALYTAEGDGKIGAEPKFQCDGDGVGREGKASYRAVTFDSEAQLLIAGDRHGVVSLINPTQPCVDAAARPLVALGETNYPITDVSLAGPGRVGVTQVGGQLHTLLYSAAGFGDQRTMPDVCSYPLGALSVGAEGMALVCIDAMDLDTDAKKASAPAAVQYQDVSVQLISLVSGLPIFQRALDVENTAGAALDPDLGRILTLKDSAIGILNVLDLQTGVQHTKKGLFLGDILD